jgi:hypothetical protein
MREMMKKTLVLSACAFLLLAVIMIAILAISYHRVEVIDGISRTPMPGAYITLERASGSLEEAGQTDASGRLDFWSAPLPLPRIICAQYTFYATACANAIGLWRQIIELPVPPNAP